MKACGCISLQSGSILIGLFKIVVYSIAISLTLLLAFTGLSVSQLKDRAFEKAQLLLNSNRVNNSQILAELNSTISPAHDPLPVPAPQISVPPSGNGITNVVNQNENVTTPRPNSVNTNNTAEILKPDVNQNPNQTQTTPVPVLSHDETKAPNGNLSQVMENNDKILKNLNELTDENLLMILGVDLMLNLLGIICSIVLVLGAHHKNFCLMNLWIFVDVLLLLAAICLAVMTSSLFDLNFSPQILLTTGSTFSYSIYLLPLDLYFVLVVFFYQREIKSSRNQLPF